MKRLLHTLLITLLTAPALGQQDTSLIHIIKPSILGVDYIKRTIDTSEFRVQSASRSLKYISDLPMSIYVVTHDDIISNGYITLTDVLKSLPGVRVSQPGSGEMGETFQFRGLLGNLYTKILINNIPVKPSIVAGMPIGSQLPIRQASRIEIIYGPAAAAYGADAVTGVINIVIKEAEKGTFVRGDIFGGAYGFNYINFTIGGKAGKNKKILNYCFYGSKTEVRDLNVLSGYEKVYNPLGNLQQAGVKIDLGNGPIDPIQIDEPLILSSGLKVEDFQAKYYGKNYQGTLTNPVIEDLGSSSHLIGLNLKYRSLGLSYNRMYRRTHSSIGLSPLMYRYDNPQNFWGDFIDQFSISYNKEWKHFSTATNISSLSYKIDNASSKGLTRLKMDRAYLYSSSSDAQIEQLVTVFPFKNTEFIMGGTATVSAGLPLMNFLEKPFNPNHYKKIDGSDIPSDPIMGRFGINHYSSFNGSLFGQAFIALNKIRLMGGIRYDGNLFNTNQKETKSSSTNPRLAIMYRYNNSLSFIGSFGTAYKTPPASIAFRSFAYVPLEEPDKVKYLSIPSKNLKPENYRSVELGFNAKVYDNIDLKFSVYYNEITNLISQKLVPIDLAEYPKATAYTDSLWASTYVNAENSESELYGFQTTLKYKNLIPSIKFSTEVSYSLTRQKDKRPDVQEIFGNFQIMPKHIGHLNFTAFPLRNCKIMLDYYWISKWLRVIVPVEDIYKNIFSEVDGYFTADITTNFRLGENLNLLLKCNNILDEKYGGLGATGTSYDLPFNPQSGFNIQFGLSYTLN